MSINKKLMIYIIILSIVCLSIFSIIINFSRFFSLSSLYSAYPVDFIERINVILAALLVWLAGKNSLSVQDNTYMKLVFIVISLGEILFLLAKPAAAISVFAICQCMLIVRHSRGLRNKIKKASTAQKLKLAFSALVLIALLFTGLALLLPLTGLNSTVTAGAIYGFILSLSLWAGIANYVLGLFPYKNSKMISVGMFCFYCCDITVGLDGLLWYGTAWLLATSLTWIFYTPAITLLALSCYKFSPAKSKL